MSPRFTGAGGNEQWASCDSKMLPSAYLEELDPGAIWV